MSRWVQGAWLVAVIVLINIGNACSRNFVIVEDDLNASLSCTESGTYLSDYPISSYKVGYVDQQTKISYVNRRPGWIMTDGDVLIAAENDLPTTPLPKGIQRGIGVRSSSLWPNGRIPYVIGSNVSVRSAVASAIAHWNTNLAGVITLVPRTNEVDYLEFRPSNSGCAAVIGLTANLGAHPVEISQYCSEGNIVHEIGHIIGLDHEQNRLDRNNFVRIETAKIDAGDRPNFDINPTYQNYLTYDFGSIMHYALSAFSIDGISRTIVPLVTVPAGVFVGQRAGLSMGDINSVRVMYGHAVIATGTGPQPGILPDGQGLFGRYYEGVDFKVKRTERIDAKVDFNWVGSAPAVGMPEDLFSIRWTGYIKPPMDGAYRFEVEAMDPMQFVIADKQILVFTGVNAVKNGISIEYDMKAGSRYPMKLDYVAKDLQTDSYLRLYWRKPDGTREIIPASVFSPNIDVPQYSPCSGKWSEKED